MAIRRSKYNGDSIAYERYGLKTYSGQPVRSHCHINVTGVRAWTSMFHVVACLMHYRYRILDRRVIEEISGYVC